MQLKDAKPGQVVKLLDYISMKDSVPFIITKVERLHVLLCDPLSSHFTIGRLKTPCRLATQDELDQLADRIRNANNEKI